MNTAELLSLYEVITIIKGMKMTRSKWRALSMLSANLVAVFLASLVFPVFTPEFDSNHWYVVVLGAGLTVFFIWLMFVSSEEGKL